LSVNGPKVRTSVLGPGSPITALFSFTSWGSGHGILSRHTATTTERAFS
jgi:hypothetical protein